MARNPDGDDSSVVSMAEYDRRARRIAGNTSEIAGDLRKNRRMTGLRLVEPAGRKTPPRLVVVEAGEGPGPLD